MRTVSHPAAVYIRYPTDAAGPSHRAVLLTYDLDDIDRSVLFCLWVWVLSTGFPCCPEHIAIVHHSRSTVPSLYCSRRQQHVPALHRCTWTMYLLQYCCLNCIGVSCVVGECHNNLRCGHMDTTSKQLVIVARPSGTGKARWDREGSRERQNEAPLLLHRAVPCNVHPCNS